MPGSTSAPGDAPSAVFLDRDGTIIVDRHYPRDPSEVELLSGAAEAIARLNHAGIPVFVVTNQSGIGRGYLTELDFRAVQGRLTELLAERGARVDGVYFCPHAPDAEPPCACRKPSAGLFRAAAEEHGVELARAVFIGDRARDVIPGVELGGRGILVGEPDGEEVAPEVGRASSLLDAIGAVLGDRRSD